jgi:hypothetical protein
MKNPSMHPCEKTYWAGCVSGIGIGLMCWQEYPSVHLSPPWSIFGSVILINSTIYYASILRKSKKNEEEGKNEPTSQP